MEFVASGFRYALTNRRGSISEPDREGTEAGPIAVALSLPHSSAEAVARRVVDAINMDCFMIEDRR